MSDRARKAGFVINYRTFRNGDPPGLVEVWNEVFTGRGAVRMQGCSWIEYFLFAKTYFDPESLIVACDANERIVGFALAGFGPDDTERALAHRTGVLSLLGVSAAHRGRGVGSGLLHRAESYLRERGGQDLFAGPMVPLNPYGFGLYGGSNSPGFLDSDPFARPFLEHKGYVLENTCLVFQRSIKRPLNVSDGRFSAHRARFDIHASPFKGTTWWQECVLGPIELHEYRVQDKLTGHTVARALLWEMETFTSRWNEPAIGITDFVVPVEARRQGLAKFLLAQILRYLHEQFFSIVEIQTRADNPAAIGLLRGLDFEQVDAGHIYRRSAEC